jgi:hypothetical protein
LTDKATYELLQPQQATAAILKTDTVTRRSVGHKDKFINISREVNTNNYARPMVYKAKDDNNITTATLTAKNLVLHGVVFLY